MVNFTHVYGVRWYDAMRKDGVDVCIKTFGNASRNSATSSDIDDARSIACNVISIIVTR